MKKKQNYTWNLKLLYRSPKDPQIEKDIVLIERAIRAFAKKYDTPIKRYLSEERELLKALRSWKELQEAAESKPSAYFQFLRDIDASNKAAPAWLALITNRLSKSLNDVEFFKISLGSISRDIQRKFLASRQLKEFRFFLKSAFDDVKHRLSVSEEKIMSLVSLPAYDMWVDGNERILNRRTVAWKGKILPIAEAVGKLSGLKRQDRRALHGLITEQLKSNADFSEAEMNAVVTGKKIDDELRGFASPYEHTVQAYRNDPAVVETLVKIVTKNFPIAHRYYRLKAKLLGQKRLAYCDRSAKIGEIKTEFGFEQSVEWLSKVFDGLGPHFKDIFTSYLDHGQIDALPRVGKAGGAYCWGHYTLPTFVLLNNVADIRSYSTIAHEMGHAFHTELSKSQGPLYSGYSMALAETASTLFESIALESVFESLPKEEKAAALQSKLDDEIATVFRQIACFNFEKEIHETIRKEGFADSEKLAEMHNKHMSAYLGPIFDMKNDDGYFFVLWSHLRRFFYVYSYAYGMLVSKALLRRYKKDKSFWKKIEQFLSAGGKDSPENILKEIGIDVSKPSFWKEGLKEIEDDIIKLEKLTKK